MPSTWLTLTGASDERTRHDLHFVRPNIFDLLTAAN